MAQQQKIIAVALRQIENFEGFDPKSFNPSPWKWGCKHFVSVEKYPQTLEQAKKFASSIEAICVGFVNTEENYEKSPLVEKNEESGVLKFVLLNAAACDKHEADVHVVYKTNSDFVKYEQYIKFEPGSIA